MSKELRQSVEDVCIPQPDGSWLVQALPTAWSWRKEPEIYAFNNNHDKEKFIKHKTNKILAIYVAVFSSNLLMLTTTMSSLHYATFYMYSSIFMAFGLIFLFFLTALGLFVFDRDVGFHRWLASAGRRVKQEDIPSYFPIRDAAACNAAWASYRPPITRILRVATGVVLYIHLGLVAAWLIVTCAPWAKAARESLSMKPLDGVCVGWIPNWF